MGMKARANVATFFKYFVLIFMGFIMVYPLLWMVGSTFKTNAEIFTSLSPFTAHPTLDGYYNAVTKTYGIPEHLQLRYPQGCVHCYFFCHCCLRFQPFQVQGPRFPVRRYDHDAVPAAGCSERSVVHDVQQV